MLVVLTAAVNFRLNHPTLPPISVSFQLVNEYIFLSAKSQFSFRTKTKHISNLHFVLLQIIWLAPLSKKIFFRDFPFICPTFFIILLLADWFLCVTAHFRWEQCQESFSQTGSKLYSSAILKRSELQSFLPQEPAPCLHYQSPSPSLFSHEKIHPFFISHL